MMGVYDSVEVPCPKCGTIAYMQSKGASYEDRLMRTFTLQECPADVLSDVNRHAPEVCQKCGTKFKVDFTLKVDNIKVMEVL